MKTIEQENYISIEVKTLKNIVKVTQDEDVIVIDKQGAKQLIEVLKGWMGED